MSDEDVGTEARLRAALRAHAQPAEGAAARLVPAVRDGLAHRPARRLAWLGALAAVALAAGTVPYVLRVNSPEPAPPAVTLPAVTALPADWRWESSLGLQAAVPGGWAVNDYGCNQTDQPSVVLGGGTTELCLTPEPPTKEIAAFERWGDQLAAEQVLERALLDPTAPRTALSVDGFAAQRVVGQLADGRTAGVVLVPDRGAALTVRARTEATALTILASLRVVEVDHVGCPALRPAVAPPAQTGPSLVDPAPTAIALCFYGTDQNPGGWADLLSSGQLTGDDAAALATLVNTASPGPNPDVPATECILEPTPPDIVLLVHGSGGEQRIWISFSGCVDRGVTDGGTVVQVNRRVVAAIMGALQIGYAFHGSLPS